MSSHTRSTTDTIDAQRVTIADGRNMLGVREPTPDAIATLPSGPDGDDRLYLVGIGHWRPLGGHDHHTALYASRDGTRIATSETVRASISTDDALPTTSVLGDRHGELAQLVADVHGGDQ